MEPSLLLGMVDCLHIKVSGDLDGTTTFVRKGGFMWFSIDHRKEDEEDFSIYVFFIKRVGTRTITRIKITPDKKEEEKESHFK